MTITLREVKEAAEWHLGALFQNLRVQTVSAEDHDSLRTGEPVECLSFNDLFELYPVAEAYGVAGWTRWAVDILVDASDPSVGLQGQEPQEYKVFRTPWDALEEIAAELARLQVQTSLQADGETQWIEDMAGEAAAASMAVAPRLGTPEYAALSDDDKGRLIRDAIKQHNQRIERGG